MLEEAKHAILISPAVIAIAVIAREDAGGGSSDLLRDLEAPVGNAALQTGHTIRGHFDHAPRAWGGFQVGYRAAVLDRIGINFRPKGPISGLRKV
jgi:hypothetical protein